MDEKQEELEPQVGQFPDESNPSPPKLTKKDIGDSKAIMDIYGPHLTLLFLKNSYDLMVRGSLDGLPDVKDAQDLDEAKLFQAQNRSARDDRKEALETYKLVRPVIVNDKATEVNVNMITGQVSPELAERLERMIPAQKKMSGNE